MNGNERWLRLRGAAQQLSAGLTATRATPLDRATLTALIAALTVFLRAWPTADDVAVDAATVLRWQQLNAQAQMATVAFNLAVQTYNDAVLQFPALCLAWLFGMKPTCLLTHYAAPEPR